MKLFIERADLLAGLNIVKNATNRAGTLPVLANVSLATTGKKLELVATNLDLRIRTRVAADVEDAGACTVNAALLGGLCSSFSGPSVELIALKTELKINCGDAKYRLSTLPADEFPPAPKATDPVEFALPQHELHRLLSHTAFCQSSDPSRHVLHGCFLSLNGSSQTATKLTAAATNGRQLAQDEAEVAEGKHPKTSFIVPTKIVTELLRLLESGEPEDTDQAPMVRVAIAKNLVQFILGDALDTVITGKLIEGDFPDYRRVIPAEQAGIALSRTDLLATLKRVSLLTEHCTLDFKGQTLTVRSRKSATRAAGEAAETFLIPKTDDLNVAFDTQYLIAALEAVDADHVEFNARPGAPSVIRVPGRPWLCVTAAIMIDPPEKPEPKAEKPKVPEQSEMPAAPAAAVPAAK